MQVKLLRAVQEGEVDPVGGTRPVKVDIRLISATHRDLLQQVKDGKFREDLFYRLNVFPIVVPPLRERREDIPASGAPFHGARSRRRERRPRVTAFRAGALAMLAAYDWPGNVRQLENAVFRASVLCDGDVLTEEEFPQIRAQVEGIVDLDRAPRSAGLRRPMRGDADGAAADRASPRRRLRHRSRRSTSAAMCARSPTSNWR